MGACETGEVRDYVHGGARASGTSRSRITRQHQHRLVFIALPVRRVHQHIAKDT
jgi:hypothetical protein